MPTAVAAGAGMWLSDGSASFAGRTPGRARAQPDGPGPYDDAGPAGPPEQAAGRLRRVAAAGDQGRPALVAAPPVPPGQHRVEEARAGSGLDARPA